MIEVRIRILSPFAKYLDPKVLNDLDYVYKWIPLEKAIQLAHEEEAKRIQDANNINNEKKVLAHLRSKVYEAIEKSGYSLEYWVDKVGLPIGSLFVSELRELLKEIKSKC